MRTARRSSSAYDGLFSAFRAFLARRAQELTGLCLIAFAGAVAIALSTWAVDDPSLNNATDLPVRNLIGWPGAIVADLFMQLLGLGAIAAVLPLALWGWRLMKSGALGRLQLRLALWVIGAGAATALASALPPTQSWPLPTGLGGEVGDPVPVRRRKIQDWDEAEEIGHDEPGWGIVSLGALAHGAMSLRAAARRWRESRRPALDDEDEAPVMARRPSRE